VKYTWSDNKVRELVTVKVLHTSLLNITVLAFKLLPLGSYAQMPTPGPPFKTILKLGCGMAFRAAVVLLLMSSMSSKCVPLNIYLREQKKSQWGLDKNVTVKVRVNHSVRRNKFTVNNPLHFEKNDEHALC
jgi:hypothetical protein